MNEIAQALVSLATKVGDHLDHISNLCNKVEQFFDRMDPLLDKALIAADRDLERHEDPEENYKLKGLNDDQKTTALQIERCEEERRLIAIKIEQDKLNAARKLLDSGTSIDDVLKFTRGW